MFSNKNNLISAILASSISGIKTSSIGYETGWDT
jgi:hypothetical protein